MATFEQTKMYIVEGDTMRYFEYVMGRLYGDGTSLSPDERRDLANGLNTHLARTICEYCPNETERSTK